MSREAWLKIEFTGNYWKIAWVMNIARVLRLKTTYYSGGSRVQKEASHE